MKTRHAPALHLAFHPAPTPATFALKSVFSSRSHLAAATLLAFAAALFVPFAQAQSPAPSQAQGPTQGPARSAPAPVADKTATKDGVEQFVLDNGLTLIVKPDHRAPTAVHMVWLRVGAMDEVDGTTGVAHVLEHMLFKGTPSMGPGEYSRRLAEMGARDNAFTSRDNTAYHAQLPVEFLPKVMAIEADRFANNRWTDEVFLKELEVVKEERRQRTEESPRAQFYEQFNAASFVASPYRRPVVGWMSDLQAMTPDDARAFYKRWYVPANAAVVVVGDVDPGQVLKLAKDTYGKIPAAPVPVRKPREEPEQHGTKRLAFLAAADQPVVLMNWKAPGLRNILQPDQQDRDALALTMLATVLDGYPSARLNRVLVQGEGKDQRLADAVGASNGLFGRGPQLFSMSITPAQGVNSAQAEAALKAEIRRIVEDGVTQQELDRVKTQWTAGEVYKRDAVYSQANELGSYWLLGMPLDAGERLLDLLRQVTPEEVRDVARRYLTDETLTVGWLVPDATKRAARRGPGREGDLSSTDIQH